VKTDGLRSHGFNRVLLLQALPPSFGESG
jgi:hypothetical protein